MKLSYKQCSIDNLETLILVSRKTFIDAFERQNNPEDFKQYMSCLLYTSPSPRDVEESRMPSSA